MESTLSDMKIKSDQTERRNAELRASEERKHNEEIAFLKKTNAQLKVCRVYYFYIKRLYRSFLKIAGPTRRNYCTKEIENTIKL